MQMKYHTSIYMKIHNYYVLHTPNSHANTDLNIHNITSIKILVRVIIMPDAKLYQVLEYLQISFISRMAT